MNRFIEYDEDGTVYRDVYNFPQNVSAKEGRFLMQIDLMFPHDPFDCHVVNGQLIPKE